MTENPTYRLAMTVMLCALISGCAREPDAVETAQQFWDAVSEQRIEDAADLVLPPTDGTDPMQVLEGLRGHRGAVEALEVPPEAEIAMLPTNVIRPLADAAEEAPRPVATVTVLRRGPSGWRVELDATHRELRAASLNAIGQRLRDAAGRLREDLGRSADEFARAFGDLASELDESLGGRVDESLERAGDALARALERFEASASGDGAAPPADATAGDE